MSLEVFQGMGQSTCKVRSKLFQFLFPCQKHYSRFQFLVLFFSLSFSSSYWSLMCDLISFSLFLYVYFKYFSIIYLHSHPYIHATRICRKFLISWGTIVICNVLYCLCSCKTKELFISWFPCFPLPPLP